MTDAPKNPAKTYADRTMSPSDVEAWLASLKAGGIAGTATEAAKALGVRLSTVSLMRQRGADRRTALACSAVLGRLAPYTAGEGAGTPAERAALARSANTAPPME